VDDGLATGSTMQAALLALRQQRPARIVVAVPVGARETCDRSAASLTRLVCPVMPEPFNAVGLWYEEFSQTSDRRGKTAARDGGGSCDARPRRAAPECRHQDDRA
jgi:predicted phosphoribosyltransferase